jgi:coniferyl-aldehyde dehydrogenase
VLPAQHTALAPVAAARVEYVRLGVIGVIGFCNDPIMCIFGPLASVLAAGNRAVIRPSEFTQPTSALLGRPMSVTFDLNKRECA